MADGSEFRGVGITCNMVLDTHEYLSSQGWSGHGNGLRHGAISRPIIIAQKKNNKGLGKERDDGFQFWNHVFDAAVKTINIKIADSDDESDDKSSSDTPAMPTLNRTSTGILSNRAPILGGSAISSETSSGTSTPTISIAPLSIFAQAKRETARRNLYGRFYRAFVIKSEDDSSVLEPQSRQSTAQPSTSASSPAPLAATAHTPLAIATSESRSKDKKKKEQKREKKAEASAVLDPQDEKRRRKAEKREKKEEKRRKEKGKDREVEGDGIEVEGSSAEASDDRKDRKSRKRKDRSDSDSTGEAKPETSGLNDAPTSAESPKKRRKKDERDEATTADLDDEAARKERKRLKREAKAAAAASGGEKKRKRKEKTSSS
ncbi:hypothetical protein K525DRAFT_252373 [Schizophyllum commune Loenen D]|nr:hypothetical protein K525DRAFT_252373 [Schizophyllum commune Loenen D]